jgi:hypothetical protein
VGYRTALSRPLGTWGYLWLLPHTPQLLVCPPPTSLPRSSSTACHPVCQQNDTRPCLLQPELQHDTCHYNTAQPHPRRLPLFHIYMASSLDACTRTRLGQPILAIAPATPRFLMLMLFCTPIVQLAFSAHEPRIATSSHKASVARLSRLVSPIEPHRAHSSALPAYPPAAS